MSEFVCSTRFIIGSFIGFTLTMLGLTFILTKLYTPNILLKHPGFYKNGKWYRVIEASKLRGCRGGLK